jgi:hypothetical protein
MILTGENGSTRRETCRSATLSIKELARTGLGSNSSLHAEKPSADSQSHGSAQLKSDVEIMCQNFVHTSQRTHPCLLERPTALWC